MARNGSSIIQTSSGRRKIGSDEKIISGSFRAEIRRWVCFESKCISGDVGGEFAIAEPSGGLVVGEVAAVGWVISFEKGVEVVVVTHINGGVTESNDGWN